MDGECKWGIQHVWEVCSEGELLCFYELTKRMSFEGLPVTSHEFIPQLYLEKAVLAHLLEQLSLNWQDRSTASQLVTGTSDTTVGFFLGRVSGVDAQEWDCDQLCVVGVGLQPEEAREVAPDKNEKWMELGCVTRVKRKRN